MNPDTPEKEGMTLEGAKWLDEKYGHLVVVVEDGRLYTDIEEVAIKAVKARSFIEGHASRDREVEGLKKVLAGLIEAASEEECSEVSRKDSCSCWACRFNAALTTAKEALQP